MMRARWSQPCSGSQHPSSAASQPGPDPAALEALLAEFLAGASRNDAAAHDRFWADSLVYTRSTGRRTGKADIMKDVREAPPAGPSTPATPTRGRGAHSSVRRHRRGGVPPRGRQRGRRPGGARRVPEHRHVREARRALAGPSRGSRRGSRCRRPRPGTGRGGGCGPPRRPARRRRESPRADPARELRMDPQQTGHASPRASSTSSSRRGGSVTSKLETSHVTVSVHGTTAVVRGDSKRQRSANPQTPG